MQLKQYNSNQNYERILTVKNTLYKPLYKFVPDMFL